MADFIHFIHDIETEIHPPQACRRRYIYRVKTALDSLVIHVAMNTKISHIIFKEKRHCVYVYHVLI